MNKGFLYCKMYWIFGIALVVSVHAQIDNSDDNLKDIINSIFATESTLDNRRPSTVPPVKNTNETDLSCTTPEGQRGECVSYYLCDSSTNIVISDGTGIIDIRFQDGPCVSYLDTCCLVADQRTDPIVPKPDKQPKRKGCGWANPQGVGMKTTGDLDGETKFGEYPWMVAILKVDNVKGQKVVLYVGGGSLIHPNVVLTAAHYVNNVTELRIRAGEWDAQNVKEIYPYQEKAVESVVVHKDFNKGNLFYDIALLFLKTPVIAEPNVGIACLPPRRVRALSGTRCFASGWGKDKFGAEGRPQVILKKIEVPVVDRDTCEESLRTTRLGRLFRLHTSFMCAGGEPGKDTCKGDGGSPLVCPFHNESDRYMQTGIVAWGIGCGEDGVPGVYVDVANLRDWIDDKVAGKGYDPKVYQF